MHTQPISDTGYRYTLPPPALPCLGPDMERALRLRVVRLQQERDDKADMIEWCWQTSQRLTIEVMEDSRQLSQFRHVLHMRGASND